jgi:hypothetical protein
MERTKAITSKGIEEKILDILDANLISTSQLAKELGLRRDLLTGYLEALKNQGKLEFHKVGKSNVYTVVRGRKND